MTMLVYDVAGAGPAPGGSETTTLGPLLSKAILKTGYRCNNNCTFCHSAPHRGCEATTAELLRKIGTARALGAEILVLSGGEPTIRRDFFILLDAIQRAGMAAGLVTNGRMLAVAEFQRRLLDHPLRWVQVSLCGPDARIHDAVTRTRSFFQTLAGIEKLSARDDLDLTVNVVVTATAMSSLGRVLSQIPCPSRTRLKFSFVEPEGNALDGFSSVVPKMSDAARAVCRALASASRVPGIRTAWDGFPLCLMTGFEKYEAALREDGFFLMSEAFEKDWHPVDDRHRGYATVCLECSLRRKCRGAYRTYLRIAGESELRPRYRRVSNSFNLIRSPQPETLNLSRCDIRHGRRPPPDAIRGLLIAGSAGKVFRCRIDSADFSDETLETSIRHERQVYRLRPKNLLPTDFARDLRKLSLHPVCERCPQHRLCPGLFRPARNHRFSRARRILAKELSRLAGDVLDIGCGTAPYLVHLSQAGEAGRLSYRGIDPRPMSIPPRFCSFAKFEKGSIDRLARPSRRTRERFDAVLALRSMAHFRRLSASLDALAELVRPGGILLLADDVVFGLERTAAAMNRLEWRKRPPFEHYRTLSADEARNIAGRIAGMRLDQFYSPVDTDSTLWLARLRKDNRGKNYQDP